MNKVKGYRVMANITQKEMAEKINISLRSYLSKESGSVDFSASELLKIKNYLNSRGLKVDNRELKLDDLL